MEAERDIQRIVIDLEKGAGPMAGCLQIEGHGGPEPFSGWIELLGLLETVRGIEVTANDHPAEDQL